jgi:hypothetical protein
MLAATGNNKVKQRKIMMIPLNIPELTLDTLATSFNWANGSLPFTYLGLPL